MFGPGDGGEDLRTTGGNRPSGFEGFGGLLAGLGRAAGAGAEGEEGGIGPLCGFAAGLYGQFLKVSVEVLQLRRAEEGLLGFPSLAATVFSGEQRKRTRQGVPGLGVVGPGDENDGVSTLVGGGGGIGGGFGEQRDGLHGHVALLRQLQDERAAQFGIAGGKRDQLLRGDIIFDAVAGHLPGQPTGLFAGGFGEG